MNTVLTVALLVIAQPTAPPVAKESLGPPRAKVARQNYEEVRDAAIAANRPMVVFIKCESRNIGGAVCVRNDSLPTDYPCIAICTPDGRGNMIWRTTLSPDATDAQVRRELQVSLPRVPFQSLKQLRSQRAESRTADDDQLLRQLPWLASGIKYNRAERIQSLSTSNNQHYVESFDRAVLEDKWNVPGGLERSTDWQSTLYKSHEVEPSVLMIPVLNSSQDYQYELGYHRSYPDGFWTADVLTRGGKPFEVRVREKYDGAWESYVVFRDPDNYPAGYAPVPTSKCMDCHREAGHGKYSGQSVPGSDTVLSDPFPAIERGFRGSLGMRQVPIANARGFFQSREHDRKPAVAAAPAEAQYEFQYAEPQFFPIQEFGGRSFRRR